MYGCRKFSIARLIEKESSLAAATTAVKRPSVTVKDVEKSERALVMKIFMSKKNRPTPRTGAGRKRETASLKNAPLLRRGQPQRAAYNSVEDVVCAIRLHRLINRHGNASGVFRKRATTDSGSRAGINQPRTVMTDDGVC